VFTSQALVAQLAKHQPGQIDPGVAGPRGRKRLVQILAKPKTHRVENGSINLVAASPDRGPDHGPDGRALRFIFGKRPDSLGYHARGEAAPTGMNRDHSSVGASRKNRNTVRGNHPHPHPRAIAEHGVGFGGP
jgi:hypothetical protein